MNMFCTFRCVWPLSILVVLTACSEDVQIAEKPIRPVRAIRVADPSTFQERWFSGKAKGVHAVNLSFRVGGPLISRDVDVGTKVKKGDLIAQIDPATFRADLEQAKANLAVAQAALADATDKLKKKQSLVKSGVENRAALDTLIAAQSQAKANVLAREAILTRTQLQFDYTSLRAPFDGIIVRTFVKNYQDVTAKQSVVRLVDNSRIEMTIDVPESLMSQAYTITRGIVRFDALPGIDIPATVTKVGTEASEATRTYPITIAMEQPKGATILPGMAGRATAAKDQLPTDASGIIVPETSIFSKEDLKKTYVWVVDEKANTVSSREIKTAGLGRRGIAVSDGLKPGEWIVTAGVNFLEDGQKVRLLKK